MNFSRWYCLKAPSRSLPALPLRVMSFVTLDLLMKILQQYLSPTPGRTPAHCKVLFTSQRKAGQFVMMIIVRDELRRIDRPKETIGVKDVLY
jgi:hypothetical protein